MDQKGPNSPAEEQRYWRLRRRLEIIKLCCVIVYEFIIDLFKTGLGPKDFRL